MKLIKHDPTTAANSLLNNLFNNNFFEWPASFSEAESNFLPPVNIIENEDNYLLEVFAAGFAKNDFKVEVHEGTLTIATDVKETNQEKNYTRKEFGIQNFRRSFKLMEKEIDAEKISAQYENGVLRLTLPKREEAKPKPARMIEIKG